MVLRSRTLWTSVTAIFVLLALVGPVLAECSISGHSSAEPNPDDPALGEWKYTVEVTWDTGSVHDLSHLDILLGFEGHECICEQFLDAFAFVDSLSGISDGMWAEEPCEVLYDGEFECNGDPSVPGIVDPLIKFEPVSPDCEPGPTGTGIFVFYSDWPPVSVPLPNSWLIEKDDGYYCFGELTGVLPELSCGSTATEPSNLSRVKSRY